MGIKIVGGIIGLGIFQKLNEDEVYFYISKHSRMAVEIMEILYIMIFLYSAVYHICACWIWKKGNINFASASPPSQASVLSLSFSSLRNTLLQWELGRLLNKPN